MITKNSNAKPRQFKGVSFDVLAVGEKSMVRKYIVVTRCAIENK